MNRVAEKIDLAHISNNNIHIIYDSHYRKILKNGTVVIAKTIILIKITLLRYKININKI